MGDSFFSNSHFHMGVTVMGFAEHFGQCFNVWLKCLQSHDLKGQKIKENLLCALNCVGMCLDMKKDTF